MSSMMNKWEKIKGHVVEASFHDDAEIVMPPSNNRSSKAAKNLKLCFDNINATTLALQERNLPLAKWCDLQEELMKELGDNRGDESSC